MNAMEPYRGVIGGFQADDISYWASTEVDGGYWHAGLFHVMGSTFNGNTGMGISMPIRCMRRDWSARSPVRPCHSPLLARGAMWCGVPYVRPHVAGSFGGEHLAIATTHVALVHVTLGDAARP